MGTRLSREEIEKLAILARLKLDQSQVDRIGSDLSAILSFVEQISELDLSQVEPLTHVHHQVNIMRDDEIEPSLAIEDVLKNAPDSSGQFIRAPIINE